MSIAHVRKGAATIRDRDGDRDRVRVRVRDGFRDRVRVRSGGGIVPAKHFHR